MVRKGEARQEPRSPVYTRSSVVGWVLRTHPPEKNLAPPRHAGMFCRGEMGADAPAEEVAAESPCLPAILIGEIPSESP